MAVQRKRKKSTAEKIRTLEKRVSQLEGLREPEMEIPTKREGPLGREEVTFWVTGSGLSGSGCKKG